MWINAFFFFQNNKGLICLKEIFHLQIHIHFSTGYEETEDLDVPPDYSPRTLQINWGTIPILMTQGNIVSHFTPLYVMISTNFRIIKFYYLPIHFYFSLLLILRYIQTREVRPHHCIINRFLHNKNIKPFTTKKYHTTNMFVLKDLLILSPWTPLCIYRLLFINLLP